MPHSPAFHHVTVQLSQPLVQNRTTPLAAEEQQPTSRECSVGDERARLAKLSRHREMIPHRSRGADSNTLLYVNEIGVGNVCRVW